LNVWWLANIVAFLLPLAWFCSAAWPARRHVSRIGLVVSAFVVSVAFSGWVGPKAAKHSYDAMWDRQERAWQAQGVTIESPRRLSSLPTLLDRVRPVGGRDHHELEVVRAYTLALPLFCSSLVLLATVLPARHRWRWIVAVSVTIAAQRLVPELLRTPGPFHLRSYFLDLLVFSYLIAIGVVSMIALLLLRRKALRALSREPWAP
jgi:hypothetical protein